MPSLIRFRDLPATRQEELGAAWAAESDRQGLVTCDLDTKISRFAAWLAPQGISFGPEDLPRRPQQPG
jgi:hypothetical protein